MNRHIDIALAMAVLLVLSALPGLGQSPARPDAPLAPTWEGALEAGGARLRLVLHLTRDAGGALAATLDSVDQGATGLPVDTVALEGDVVRLGMSRLGASFHGRLAATRDAIAGTWSQGGMELPLTFHAVAVAATVSRPQEPRPPFAYRAVAVTVTSRAADVRLAGTLTLPAGPGPFPALVLITGSGPEDRDETVFGHRPFLVLADHLTRAGLAVLRCDDRGVGGSSPGPAGATSADLVADVLAEVAFLKARPDIDPARVGLLGHSEGGLIAAMAAADSPEPAFVVLLAGPGLRGDRVLALQAEALGRAAGLSDAELAAAAKINAEVYRIVVEEADDARAAARIRGTLAAVGMPEEQRETQIRVVLSPWFRFFLAHDPAPDLARIKVPVLALTGERDLQVVAGPNLAAIRAALDGAGHTDHEVRELPGLNHLFQECRTGAISEYATIEQTFAPAALEAIARWVTAHTARAAAAPGGPATP